MSFKDLLTDPANRPKVITAGVLLIAAIVFFFFMSGSEAPSVPSRAEAKATYSIDDGATWFEDSTDLVPPFDHGGKPASEAMLYAAEGGGKPFVGYLQRFTAAAKKQLDAVKGQGPRSPAGIEVKRPGAASSWVSRNSKEGADVVNNVKAPDGKPAQPVTP